MAEEKKDVETLEGQGAEEQNKQTQPEKKVHRRGSKQHQCQEQQEGSRQAHEYTV